MHVFHEDNQPWIRLKKWNPIKLLIYMLIAFFFTNTENLKKSEFKIKKCTLSPPKNNVNKIVQLCCFLATDLLL